MKVTDECRKVIALEYDDLADSYSNLPINEIRLHHFKGSIKLFEYADLVIYQDKDTKEFRVLKDRQKLFEL